ncbi:hairy-related 8a [Megalops cyprinoides]|uniref:hairy-related 8a n=1 Tax=Megalops cyprinoides TaxID=118141 RepID=UPI0018655CEA|nr:hairy-related 8a [Megalops cyprinoides]
MTASNMGSVSERNFNAKEERKLRKPLIEKRRRERINCSLEQLKGIMVDAYNLDQSKLEKADVLEITVQHMESLQRSNGAGVPGGTLGLESRQRYSSGYIQCMHEVHNLLLSCPGMDKTLGARLLNHLLKSLPHVSGKPGGALSSGAATNSSKDGCGPLPTAPPHSPLSLPLAAFQPHPLHLHASASPPPPPSPTSPQLSPRFREAAEASGGSREPVSPSPPGSPSPVPHAGLLHPALPPFFPGGDPSMWRPW